MDQHTVHLVKTSFRQIAPIAETAASLFYTRLFQLDPSLKALFKQDIGEQGKKLMHMLGIAVTGLDKLDTLVAPLQELALRHRQYGVKDSDYQTVGEALLWTLEQGLRDDYTPEVKDAWQEVYKLIASVMKDAANNK